MINIEDFVFNTVATSLRSQYTSLFMSGEYVDVPSKFPAVTLMESSNSVVTRMRTANAIENAVTVMYEANVYSNKTRGKKAQAKQIMASLDEEMSSLGFTRVFMNPIPNFADATIYRLTARYEAVVVPNDDGYRIYTN